MPWTDGSESPAFGLSQERSEEEEEEEGGHIIPTHQEVTALHLQSFSKSNRSFVWPVIGTSLHTAVM